MNKVYDKNCQFKTKKTGDGVGFKCYRVTHVVRCMQL